MLWFFVTVAAMGLVAAGVWYWRRERAGGDDPRLTCRCPKCDRLIRYPASHAGHYAICKGCKYRVPLPYEPEEGAGKQEADPYRIRRKIDKADRS